MIEHTPGPWRLCESGVHEFDVECMAVHQFHGTFLRITLGNGAPETLDYYDAAKFQATARLIEAVPELLGLAEGYLRLLVMLEGDKLVSPGVKERVSTVIAKAKGEAL